MIVNKLTIIIDNYENSAMVNDRTGETCRILRDLCDSMQEYGVPNADGSRLMDFNGNQVGLVAVDFEDDREQTR